MEDDVEGPEGINSHGDVDMERDHDNAEEQDKQEDDGEEEDEQMEDEDEEEAKDEADGKEPRMIGQGDMLNILAQHVYTVVDNEPIVSPEQDQEMREITPWPQPVVPTLKPQTLKPSPRP